MLRKISAPSYLKKFVTYSQTSRKAATNVKHTHLIPHARRHVKDSFCSLDCAGKDYRVLVCTAYVKSTYRKKSSGVGIYFSRKHAATCKSMQVGQIYSQQGKHEKKAAIVASMQG